MSRLAKLTVGGAEAIDSEYAPYTAFPKLTQKVIRLPSHYSFDLDRARYETKKIVDRYGLRSFAKDVGNVRQSQSYRGICFTSRQQSNDPLYEGLRFYGEDGIIANEDIFRPLNTRTKIYPDVKEREFSQPTEILNGVFKDILSRFRSRVTKARLVELRSRGLIPPHLDFPYYKLIKVHAAIFTNENCSWYIEGERFHIPADGHFYWLDSGRLHAAENTGRTHRIHFNVNLDVYERWRTDSESAPPPFFECVSKCTI